MNEKEIAQFLYEDLKEHSKNKNFISLVEKPEYHDIYIGYNIDKLKIEAQKLGFNIFQLSEIKSNDYIEEKGETLIVSFYGLNDL